MASYVEKLKSSNPEYYSKLEKYLGANPNDWQAQIFTPLDLSQVTVPGARSFVGGNPIWENGQVVGYTADLGKVNGMPITAKYDAQGNVTGYTADQSLRNWVSGNQSYGGQWDANGKPVPVEYKSSSGSVLGGIASDIGGGISDLLGSDLGKIAAVAAMYYGGPAALEALSSGAATTIPEAINMGTGAFDAAAAAGASEAVGGTGLGAALSAELPAGSQYVAPNVTELGKVASASSELPGATADLGSKVGLQATPGEGLNLANASGAPGLQTGPVGTSLADMGGAQGLTTPGATGGILGAAGVNGADAATIAGLGSNNVTGLGTDLAAIKTGVTPTGTTPTGTTLSDILPIVAGGQVVSGLINANTAKTAAQIQADAAKDAAAKQQANLDLINKQLTPYRAGGAQALNTLGSLGTGPYQMYDAAGNVTGTGTGSGYLQHQFNAADLQAGLAPNYDFMLQQGQMANQRAANLAGGGLGGNALQGLNKFTQDYAGNAYQNAFQNYQTQRTNIYNTLAGIAGLGMQGQNAANTAMTNATNAATQLGVGSAAAQAAGQVGASSAIGNTIGNIANQYTLASLLNQKGSLI